MALAHAGCQEQAIDLRFSPALIRLLAVCKLSVVVVLTLSLYAFLYDAPLGAINAIVS